MLVPFGLPPDFVRKVRTIPKSVCCKSNSLETVNLSVYIFGCSVPGNPEFLSNLRLHANIVCTKRLLERKNKF